MTQVSMHSRMVEWLSAQPDQIRAADLQHFPAKVTRDIARMILKNMRRVGASDSELAIPH